MEMPAEKLKQRDNKKKDLLLMGDKFKRRPVLVGQREGYSTPSPTWNFGIVQPDGTLIPDFSFPPTSKTSLSARQLGANLWEMHRQHQINHIVALANVCETVPILGHPSVEKVCESSDENSSEQPTTTSSIHLQEELAASPTQHNLLFTNTGQFQEPLSPGSYCSSMEMLPHNPAISSNGYAVGKDNSGVPKQSLKTSSELLKLLNRIWSLEEKHALDMSIVKMLRRELHQSQTQIKTLLQEKKRDRKEIENLTKQMMQHKIARKKEQDQIRDAVKSVEVELKLRRNWAKLHHELVKELKEMKSLFMDALRDLERERRARKLLEGLCDEFAKGIRDCEKQVQVLKHKSSEDQIGAGGYDGLILHISEAWLDERSEIILMHSHEILEKQSAMDRLYDDIETFLQAKQSGNSWENDLKHPSESNLLAHSLESFHLNEPASVPWKEIDEGDSPGLSIRCSEPCRGMSLKQGNELIKQLGEMSSDGYDEETAKARKMKKNVHALKDSDSSCRSHLHLEEHANERKDQLVNETNNPRKPRKGELMPWPFPLGEDCSNKVTDEDADLQDAMKHPSATSDEEKNLVFGNICMEGSNYDHSAFLGHGSPVRKWPSASQADPNIFEASSRQSKSIKTTTLTAKLMEARLEGKQYCGRASKGFPSQGD